MEQYKTFHVHWLPRKVVTQLHFVVWYIARLLLIVTYYLHCKQYGTLLKSPGDPNQASRKSLESFHHWFFATLSWDHHLLHWTVNTWQFSNGRYAWNPSLWASSRCRNPHILLLLWRYHFSIALKLQWWTQHKSIRVYWVSKAFNG